MLLLFASGIEPEYAPRPQTAWYSGFLRVSGAPTHSVCVQAAQMLEELACCHFWAARPRMVAPMAWEEADGTLWAGHCNKKPTIKVYNK